MKPCWRIFTNFVTEYGNKEFKEGKEVREFKADSLVRTGKAFGFNF